jgi:cell division protein FtsQ
MRKVKVKVSGARSRAQLLARARQAFLSRPILLLSCLLAILAAAAGVWSGGYIGAAESAADARAERLLASTGLAVRKINLSGEEQTSADAAYRALAVPLGQPILAISPEAARARLMNLPWVKDAEVRRQFPDVISVRLIEKRPFALWRTADALWVVERSGAVITTADRAGFPRLPLLVGEGAPDAAAPLVDALSGQTAISARLQAIERIGDRRWDLHLNGGVVVRLPEEQWESQLTELETLIVEKGVLERDIEAIDLRYPDNYVFKLRNGDSRPVPRERRA